MLAQRIRERRLSFEEFSERLEVFARENNEVGTVSTRHVQRLTAGGLTSNQLRPATARLLERFFESPIDELLSAPENGPQETVSTTEGRSRREPDPVPFEEFLKQYEEPESSARDNELSARESDPLAQADQTRHMMDRVIAERTVTPAQVDKIDHMVRLHAQACVTMPPLVMLRRLVADFDELRGLISQVQSPTTLVRLYACSARIGALVADELMVLGDTHRAWAWHHSATVAADETGLPELGLQVRSLGILIPLYSGDSREALSMAVEACDLSGSIVDRSSPAYVLTITLKALILAQLGLVDECRAALGESGESFTRLDRAGRADSVFGFSERRWHFYRARTLAELGEFDEAWEAQDRALELYPTDMVGDPTIIQLDRALCLVRRNDIDGGCGLAADALSNLPPEHHASIFLEYGKRILAVVPEKYSNRRLVGHYRAAIVESSQAIGVM
ncbi:MAG: hypothetical protein ACRDR6_06045 [Pseudonocardiaceae bacterium]